MVNRILIRLKVVQMLYSYMLTRSEFRIESAPEKQTRDSIYAYNLYQDLLLLILRLSGQKISPADQPIAIADSSCKNPLINMTVPHALSSIAEIREAGNKRIRLMDKYTPVAQTILDKIITSSAYKDYAKKRSKQMADEITVWTLVLNTIIRQMPEFITVCRTDPNFSLSGMERAFNMATNTLKNYSDTKNTLIVARKALEESLSKAYELYCNLLWLPVELTRMRQNQLEQAKEKYLPSDDDLNPNLRFVENKAVKAIEESQALTTYFKTHPSDWSSDYFNLKIILDNILSSKVYAEYMANDNDNYETDCEFWRQIFKQVILPSDALAEILESKSVYWNDDLYVIGTFVLKTFRKMSTEPDNLPILPKFKDVEDEKFGPDLFLDAVNNSDEYRQLVDKFVNAGTWDPERLAFMDQVILITAIAEILNFEKIPIPVTLNEYIEIANYYSTERSGQFINGILFSIINYLKSEGKLHKEFGSNNANQ